MSIDAPPDAVLDLLADPLRLPQWAPAFARSARQDVSDWIISTDAGEFHRHVPVSRDQGTVDFLERPGARRGLFTRVVGNGDGSQLTFTLVGDDSSEQRAVLDAELAAVKRLCEA